MRKSEDSLASYAEIRFLAVDVCSIGFAKFVNQLAKRKSVDVVVSEFDCVRLAARG